MDFHLAYYLGLFSDTAPMDAEFHVISRDTGYDGLIAYIRKSGRTCVRVSPLPRRPKKINPPKAVSLSAGPACVVADSLNKIPGRLRPKSIKSLHNWIKSHAKNSRPDRVVQQLVNSGMLQRSNNTLIYRN